MDIKDLVPVDYSNQRVLLTTQVAQVFNTTTERISHNFSENKHRFKEGEHYFKLIGAALRSFKQNWGFSTFAAQPLNPPFSRMANCLYLWTEQGTMLHCKMVNTDEAWKMLKDLIAFYFEHRDTAAPAETPLSDEEPVKKVKRKPLPEYAVVYAALLDNTLTKIGLTTDFNRRIKEVLDILPTAKARGFRYQQPMLLMKAKSNKVSTAGRCPALCSYELSF